MSTNTEEVTLAKEDQESLVKRLVSAVRGEVKREKQEEQQADAEVAELADTLYSIAEERAKQKEQTPPPPSEKTPEKKEENKPPPEKKPEDEIKELEAKITELKSKQKPVEGEKKEEKKDEKGEVGEKKASDKPPPPPPVAEVNKLNVEDWPQEYQDAIEEVAKNPQAGFSTILRYMHEKKKSGGDQL